MKIAFWNINNKSFIDDIVDLVQTKDIDFLILAECKISSKRIADKLSTRYKTKKYYSITNKNRKFKIVSRIDISAISNFDGGFGGESWSVFKCDIPKLISFSIVSVHLPSKLHWDEASQMVEAISMMNSIRKYEEKNGHNTLIVGDFNMNPYEPGMVSTMGLHGIKDTTIVKKKNREVQGKLYDFLYNPMWNYLGDHKEVPGTYYYRTAIHNSVMWNTFDQILFRPSLLKCFKPDSIEIITKISSKKPLIVPKTKRISNLFSDHLPISINLNISNGTK